MHVAQGVWALQNFEEDLTCNIWQCKMGITEEETKNIPKFLLKRCSYI